MTLSPAWLDELRARTQLSTLVARTVKITKAGREYKGCCPFHNEKTPSFYVNDEKGFYHCFGCSAHGDAIRWMTDHRGLPFIDAVKELADAAGLEMPADDPQARERSERANSLYDVMQAAAAWFADQLNGVEGAEAQAYIKKRGLRADTVKGFGLGYAPDSKTKLKTALAHFGEDKLIEAGLLIKVDEKDSYDRFRGRLMIPIRDARGRVIAFGGRILAQGEPKYLNSPDTPLFDKGRTLYNLDRAASASRKSNRVLVVEGYMDVIALAQAGIDEAVAPLGTALTEHQIARLWRMSDQPILCFDGDAAGQKAAIRAIGRALPGLAPAQSLRFVTLPSGQDPDDVVKSGGRSAMEAILAAAEPLVERLWRHELEAEPLTTPEARAGLRQRLRGHAQAIADPNVRDQYQLEFQQRFDAAFRPQGQQRAPYPNRTPMRGGQRGRFPAFEAPPGGAARKISGQGVDALYVRAILTGLILHPTMILACAEALAALPITDKDLADLRNIFLDAAYDHAALDSQLLITICEERGSGAFVAQLVDANGLAFSFTRRQSDAELARRDLGMAIEALAARPELDAALEAATARLAENWDELGFAEQMRLQQARREADAKLAALAERASEGD
ncbi:MAG: DNA primase [Alphaproteobacteria bacterium]|nr:DNA primase [Alphaproteobacteria bacterium]